jgi:plastocyanin
MRRAPAAVVALALVVTAAALAAPGGRAGYENPKLFATVGPGASIVVRDGAGNRVTQVAPGTYDVVVNDLADEHNFHLTGPGFDRFTSVEGTGQETWTVTLTDGEFRYLCDPHATVMRSSFRVGAGTPPATPPPPPAAARTKLVGTVGPGFTIALRTPAGRAVKSLKAGRYAITVRDRASTHNFHLLGAGVNRRTGVGYRGTTAKAWTVTLKKGTLRWLCDPHATQMRGSAKVG